MCRRYNRCVHYQQFWRCLKQLSAIPSSKGPRGDTFQSKNTDQLKQKKGLKPQMKGLKIAKHWNQLLKQYKKPTYWDSKHQKQKPGDWYLHDRSRPRPEDERATETNQKSRWLRMGKISSADKCQAAESEYLLTMHTSPLEKGHL